MPHLFVEHSANVETSVDMQELVDALHDAALATGTAALDALRTRAVRREVVAIADRHPDNAFIAVTIRIGAGRDADEKRRLVAALMAALDKVLGDAQASMMLSVEVQEIDPEFRMNKNNLRPLVAQRRAAEKSEANRKGETDGR
jgi:5-carboxymethyl-2-hydroxymuconate isomerase